MRPFSLARSISLVRERLAQSVQVCSIACSRLGFKFLAIVVGTVLLGTLLSFLLTLVFQHRQIVDNAHSTIQHTGIAIQTSLRHAMLSNDFVMLGQMVNSCAPHFSFSG